MLLLSSAAPPQQASPLTSPAEKSAFMFFSKSQVVLPRATLTEPGAKAALSSVPAQAHTRERVAGTFTAIHAHDYSSTHWQPSTNVPSSYPPTHYLHTRVHMHPLIVSTPWLSLRLIKRDGFIEGGRVEASAE